MASTKSKGLTVLQKRFCDILHTMKEPNQGLAYQLAGSKSDTKAAEAAASRTLRIVKVKRYFDSLQKASTENAIKTKDDIIRRLEGWAFADLYELINIDPRTGAMSFKKISELTKEQRTLLSQITEKDTAWGTHRSLKIPDPLKAAELLMRYHNMFKDEHDDQAETFAEALHNAYQKMNKGSKE